MLAILLLAAAPAPAQGPAVLDLAALPSLGADCRSLYAQRFLLGNLPRAFAIGAGGQCGGRWGAASAEAARSGRAEELRRQRRHRLHPVCRRPRSGLAGPPETRPPAPPGPLLAGEGWAFVPDERFFWQGPGRRARRGGVRPRLQRHGRAVDSPRRSRRPIIRAFNNAGFDVVRFAREWRYDYRADEMARHLREGLRRSAPARLENPGPRRPVARRLEQPAGARHARPRGHRHRHLAGQERHRFRRPDPDGQPELWIITSQARAASTRVAFVQFRDDPFYTDGDERVSIIRRLQDKVAALLVIDRPDGITGHGGGGTASFAERYGACLLRFATAAAPASC